MRNLGFPCTDCRNPIHFTFGEIAQNVASLSCEHCHKTYDFSDETLQRHIRKFLALCEVLQDSEEILGQAAVGVDVGPHHVHIPFRLLLTRLGTTLQVELEEESIILSSRHEPIRDFSLLQKECS